MAKSKMAELKVKIHLRPEDLELLRLASAASEASIKSVLTELVEDYIVDHRQDEPRLRAIAMRTPEELAADEAAAQEIEIEIERNRPILEAKIAAREARRRAALEEEDL